MSQFNKFSFTNPGVRESRVFEGRSRSSTISHVPISRKCRPPSAPNKVTSHENPLMIHSRSRLKAQSTPCLPNKPRRHSMPVSGTGVKPSGGGEIRGHRTTRQKKRSRSPSGREMSRSNVATEGPSNLSSAQGDGKHQPINHAVNHVTNHSANHATNHTTNLAVNHVANHPGNHSGNHPANHSDNHSITNKHTRSLSPKLSAHGKNVAVAIISAVNSSSTGNNSTQSKSHSKTIPVIHVTKAPAIGHAGINEGYHVVQPPEPATKPP